MSWELLRRILNCDWNYILSLKAIFGNIVKPDFEMETNLFKARHQVIAEKLFEILYDKPESKLEVFTTFIENISPNNEYQRNLLRQVILNKKLHDELGQISFSNKIFEAARKVVPYDPVVIQHLGITFMKMGMEEQAEATFKEALKYYPENPAVYNSQGILYEQIAFRFMNLPEPDTVKANIYFQKAHEAFQKSISYGRGSEHGYDRYGRFLFKLGRYYDKNSNDWEEIVGKIRGLIEDARDNVSEIKLNAIDNLQGRLNEVTGDLDRATEIYEKILTHEKSNHNVRYNLAWIYFRQKKYSEAINVLKPSIDEEIKDFRFYKLYSRLIRLKYPEKLKELILILLKAHSIDSEDLDINFQLGVAFYKLGELSKAFSYFRNCDGLSYKRPDRFKTLTMFEKEGDKKEFYGNIKKIIHETRGLVIRDIYNDEIFFNPSRNPKVQEGDRVKFNIGFCFVGPQALDLRNAV
jgi:tetratricopeptide (TPR) repeat protein